MWTQITETHGPIDILINNAAIVKGKLFSEMVTESEDDGAKEAEVFETDEFRQTFEVNFFSYVTFTRLFLT